MGSDCAIAQLKNRKQTTFKLVEEEVFFKYIWTNPVVGNKAEKREATTKQVVIRKQVSQIYQ